MNLKYDLHKRIKFTGLAWTWYDTAYKLQNYDNISFVKDENLPVAYLRTKQKTDDRQKIELRELYVDIFLPGLDLRIGKQLAFWGVLEGQRIVNELHPMDFRELILPDIVDFLIPLWMVKSDIYLGDTTLELLWIPDIVTNKPAPPGSEWELFQRLPNEQIPESNLMNSEFGVKLSRSFWETDLALSYFYTWDDFPAAFRRFSGRKFTGESPPAKCQPTKIGEIIEDPDCSPVFHPLHPRINMYGMTLSRNLGLFILNGEAAYVTGKYFGAHLVDKNADCTLDNDGEIKKNHVRWGMGIDFRIMGIDFSPAFMEWIILNYDDSIIQKKHDQSASLFVRTELLNGALIFQYLHIHLLTMKEFLSRPKFIYNLTEKWQTSVGLDIIVGFENPYLGNPNLDLSTEPEKKSFFLGNFNNNKRIYWELKYSF